MSKSKRKQQSKRVGQNSSPWDNELNLTLATLASKRTGGSINIRGIEFQLLYAAHRALTTLKNESADLLRFEGIEDIDVYVEATNEFIQAKTSENRIDAGAFWDLGVLQNFLRVYKIAPASTFKLVYNNDFKKGMMDELISKQFTDQGLKFWTSKLNTVGGVSNALEFLGRITFEKFSAAKLQGEIIKSLVADFNVNVNVGSEIPFVRALFYNVFDWSKNRSVVGSREMTQLMQSVRDSFASFPVNPAVQHKWINRITFEPVSEVSNLSYYDGKAARPSDIASGLPVKRVAWERDINKSVSKFDVTVIRSSSGQGKSTLAWMSALAAIRANKSVYQLAHCTSRDEAVAISDFIESRLLLGESPLIVVDGLNQETSQWLAFAELVRSKPVKLIITTREEDWVRYGGTNAIELKVVDIRLSMDEAKEIFTGLRNSNRIHASIKNWEPVWERVRDKGLLIEYVYLLTQGEMIETRLSQQIRILNSEVDSPAKIEILRLVSLADVLNLRVRTQSLTDSILSKFTLSKDRNELLRQLEKEYYLKFDAKYIEGLHPVRSAHLVNVLNSNIEVNASLLDLLKIIDDDYIYEYFISAPLQFELDDEFFRAAADVVSLRPYSEMVYVVDGLMHSEPYHYWKQNKEIFDEVFQRGGLDLAVYDTVPINNPNALEKLADSMGPLGENLRYIEKKLKERKPYDFRSSAVYRFAKHLQLTLDRQPKSTRLEGIAFLYRWFKAIGLDFPDVIQVKEEELMNFLKEQDIGAASELFGFYNLVDPKAYRAFLAKHKPEVIGWIKKKTNTLTIKEVGDELHINYLLDNNISKINESSVYRINIVRAFLPSYTKYCTEAIVLPFPNEATVRAAHQMSKKAIEPKNLSDEFNVRVNQIWSKVILDQYAATSVYEWQKAHLSLRGKGVELARKCLRAMEAALENNQPRIRTLIQEISVLGEEFLTLDGTRLKYPPQSRKYFEKNSFEAQEKNINKFRGPLRNFFNQFFGLVAPKNERDSHLPVVNIKDAATHITDMQNAYEEIMASTHKYFSTDEVRRHESTTITRLANTASFYANRLKTGIKEQLVVAERFIDEWVSTEERRLLRSVQEILTGAKDEVDWQFTFPTKVIERSSLKNVTIGIQGYQLVNDDDLWKLSVALRDLATIGIDYFHMVVADHNKTIIGGFRLHRDYFEKFRNAFDNVDIDNEWSLPFPIDLNDPAVEVPSDFTMRNVSLKHYEDYFRMMYDIWKLGEYRDRLNLSDDVESDWLAQIETEYKIIIERDFASATAVIDQISPSETTVSSFLKGDLKLTSSEIVGFITDMIHHISQQQGES